VTFRNASSIQAYDAHSAIFTFPPSLPRHIAFHPSHYLSLPPNTATAEESRPDLDLHAVLPFTARSPSFSSRFSPAPVDFFSLHLPPVRLLL
jgi:hypothetical protein